MRKRELQELLRWKPGDPPHVRIYTGELKVSQERAADDGSEDFDFFIEGTASAANFMGDGILLDPAYMPVAFRDYVETSRLLQASHSMSVRNSVGRVIRGMVGESGLWVRAGISAAEQEIRTKVREKILRALSLAFLIQDAVWDDMLEVVRALKYRIPEISIVSLGEDPGALFVPARQFSMTTEADKRHLREIFVGTDEDDASPEERRASVHQEIARRMVLSAISGANVGAAVIGTAGRLVRP